MLVYADLQFTGMTAAVMGRTLKWAGGLIAVLAAAVLGGYFAAVGLDKADKLASVLGAFIGLAGLAISAYGTYLGNPGETATGGGSGQTMRSIRAGGNVIQAQARGDVRISEGPVPDETPRSGPAPAPAVPPVAAVDGPPIDASNAFGGVPQASDHAPRADGAGDDAGVDR